MTLDRNWEKIEIKTILRSSYHLLPLQKQYQNPILLLHWDYFNHISAIYVPNVAHISFTIYHQNQLHILVIRTTKLKFDTKE